MEEKIRKTVISKDYKPSKDEEFMNPMHLEYFKKKLESWKEQLIQETNHAIKNIKNDELSASDENDRASLERDRMFELRLNNRQGKLISKINKALTFIDNGTYGYCEITGNKIPLERLEIKPTATMTLEAQEIHERKEKTKKDT